MSLTNKFIGLRHDVDHGYFIGKSIRKIRKIEEKYNVRSTLFVRTRIIRGKRELIVLLKEMEDEGWEIGLHLDNTVDEEKAGRELNELLSYGFNVKGATPHGGIYGFSGERTWRVLDSLRLSYVQGYGKPPEWMKTKVLPAHITLDWYIRDFGDEKGYQIFRRELDTRLSSGSTIVMTHADYFTFSVGFTGTMKPRRGGLKVRAMKAIGRLSILIGTILRVRILDNIYERFLQDYKNRAEMTTLSKLSRVL